MQYQGRKAPQESTQTQRPYFVIVFVTALCLLRRGEQQWLLADF
jgi:hypothetical protein